MVGGFGIEIQLHFKGFVGSVEQLSYGLTPTRIYYK